MMQSGSDVHVLELAVEHVDDILNAALNMFEFCNLTVTCLEWTIVDTSGDLAKLAITIVDYC